MNSKQNALALIENTSGSNCEEMHNYRHVVVVLEEDWRVIECADRVQWIVQKRMPGRYGQSPWKAKFFTRDRRRLFFQILKLIENIDPEVFPVLDALPDHFGDQS